MCRYFAANNFLLPLGKKTYIMSILNLTPDSFSDGGKWNDKDIAIKKALQMVEEGADILDVGAQSTRPGYTQVSAREEIDRLKNILPKIRKKVNIPISIDTFYPEVAEYAIKEGVDIINDITGFEDERMVQLASNCSCGLIVMHNTTSEDIRAFFERKLKELTDKGIETKRICFDPGIGFSKTYEQNLHVLKNIKEFKDWSELYATWLKANYNNDKVGLYGYKGLIETKPKIITTAYNFSMSPGAAIYVQGDFISDDKLLRYVELGDNIYIVYNPDINAKGKDRYLIVNSYY